MTAKLLGSMTETQYRVVPGIRSSDLKAGLRSMAHLQVALERSEEEVRNQMGGSDIPEDVIVQADIGEGLVFGNFFHAFLLEAMDKVLTDYQFPAEDKLPWNRKDGIAQKERIKALCTPVNKPVIWPKEYRIAEAMREAVHASPFWPVMEGMRACTELAIHGEINGTLLKCKLDLFDVNSCTVVNLKTTRDGHPRSFSRDVLKLSYWLQAAVECSLVQALTGHLPDYYWAVIEKFPPYNFTVYRFDPASMAVAKEKLRLLLEKWEAAKKAQLAPGYSEGKSMLTYCLPSFMMEGSTTFENDYNPEE